MEQEIEKQVLVGRVGLPYLPHIIDRASCVCCLRPLAIVIADPVNSCGPTDSCLPA